MADYIHSENYHKIVEKIQEINNLKDLETFSSRLSELEQDSEVKELLAKCDERKIEIKNLIREEKYREKYQKAISEYNNPDFDIDSLISQFEDFDNYKDSAKILKDLKKEKKYRVAVMAFETGNVNHWENIQYQFESLGDYKKSKEYFEACTPKVEAQQREEELRKKREAEAKKAAQNEATYKKALDELSQKYYGHALDLFQQLEDYKDSKAKAEECRRILDEYNETSRRARKKKQIICLVVFIIAILVWIIIGLVRWQSDDDAHWHSVCGIKLKSSSHDYSLVMEKGPTCEESGYYVYDCVQCNRKFVEDIPAFGHSNDGGVVKNEPTCTENGLTIYSCVTCGTVLKEDVTEATGHTSDSGIVSKEATCTLDGVRTYRCIICDAVLRTEPIPATGHFSDTGKISKEATCISDGIKTYRCIICDAVLRTEPIPAMRHFSDTGKISKEATCISDGIKTYRCITCGATLRTESIAQINHKYVDTIISEPNCESRGLIQSVCSVCGYISPRTIDATGHKWKESSTVEPSCDQEGSRTYVCSVCNEVKVEKLSASGHKWTEKSRIAATCLEDGSSELVCSVCGSNEKRVIEATGHKYYEGLCINCGFDSNRYAVWGTGPAGGIIFYDCDADNLFGNKDGLVSSECGWRFLEAAPEDITVGSTTKFVFGYYRTSASGDNLYVNGTTKYNNIDCTGTAIGTGKSNTAKLVAAMGSSAYQNDKSSHSNSVKVGDYAARLCDNYSYGGYSDWFLPSKDELNLMYTSLAKNGLGSFAADFYWSSSESSYSGSGAWDQVLYFGDQYDYGRVSTQRVRAIRAF